MSVGHGTAILAVALAVAACKGREGAKIPLGQGQRPRVAVDTSPEAIRNNPHVRISPAAQAALDSGNALYRAKKYELALVQYRLAAKIAPANAAPYYGIGMVATQLGNKALADSAMQAVSQRAENTGPMFEDSLMKKAHLADSAKAMPKS